MDPKVFDRQYPNHEMHRGTGVSEIQIEEWKALMKNKRAMHDAVKNYDVDTINFLLDNGMDVNVRETSRGYTPLHVAIKEKFYPIAYLLLQRGADINKVTKSGATALDLALETRDENMVFLVLTSGMNFNVKRFDKSPLHLAVEFKMFDVVDFLLKNGCNVNDVTKVGKTALHTAIEAQDVFTVDLLLSHNARVDLKMWGKCPLYMAVEHGFYEIATLLLNKRTDEIFHCKNVHTALYLAFSKKDLDMVTIFMEHHINPNWIINKKSFLYFAVEYQWEGIVQKLLVKGTDLSLLAKSNNSFLHVALKKNNRSIIRSLLDYGAEVNIQEDFTGDTPLHLAVKNQCLESVRILLEKGADPNRMNNQRFTPLHLAFDLHQQHIVEQLLAFRGDLLISKQGKSVLEISIECEWQHFVEQLLREGADANSIDSDNVTMLIKAVKQNSPEIMQLLLRYGADIHGRDRVYDMTPLQFAAARGRVNVAKFLIQRGADVNCINSHGVTALMLALIVQPNKDMVTLLLENNAAIDLGGLSEEVILHVAVKHDWVDVAEAMITRGADVNQCMHTLFQTVKNVIETSKANLAKLLSSFAIDIWKLCTQDFALINVAMVYGSGEMVELLLKYGATIECLSPRKRNPLFIAFERRNVDMLGTLIKVGCNPRVQDPVSNQTLLHLAALHGCNATVSLMLANGLEVDDMDANGKTPLMYAVSSDHVETVKLLLEQKGRPTSRKNNLYESLIIAIKLRNYKMVEVLLSKQVPLGNYEEPDNTALGIAVCEITDGDMLRLLLDYDLYDNKQPLTAEDILCHVGHIVTKEPVFAEQLIEHVARRSLKVNVSDDWETHSIPDKMRDHYEECLKEIEEMKKQSFFHTISFYDILTKHPRRLAVMMRNEKAREKFYYSNYKINYPIFENSLRYCMKKIVSIIDSTIGAEETLERLTRRSLPHYVMQRIFNYMHDTDLKEFSKVFSQTLKISPTQKEFNKNTALNRINFIAERL